MNLAIKRINTAIKKFKSYNGIVTPIIRISSSTIKRNNIVIKKSPLPLESLSLIM